MSRWERGLYNYMLWIAIGPIVVAVVVIAMLALINSTTPTTSSGVSANRTEESGLEAARSSLARQTDLSTCHACLIQINSELSDKPSLRPPSLTKEQRDWLSQHAGLDGNALAEINDGSYTRLDDHHLDRCFLMRDAVRALEVKGVRTGPGGAVVQEPALERAKRAFDWVVREVRLREHQGEVIPPTFVLRRGWGSALERAHVFLALLEQLGDPNTPQPEVLGCLLYVPDGSGGLRFWACGVVADKDVHLFDPRLGLPLPGPKGQGIATLAEVRKQPDILTQLNVNEKYRYDVTAEQAREIHARLVCPLSSLSPRMRYLQENVLVPVVRVRLTTEPAKDLERLKTACAAGAAKPPLVELSKGDVDLLRRFLPSGEGGIDEGISVRPGDSRRIFRKDRLTLALVPWGDLPDQFKDESRFPPDIGLGDRVRKIFASPFIASVMNPGHPRDQLLRGRYSTATQTLVSEHERLRDQQKQRASATDLEQRADEWLQRATRAYANMLRARTPPERETAEQEVKQIWEPRQAGPIYLILNSSIAIARNPEAAYQLGLCGQEQAEQLQARIDLQARVPGAAPHPVDIEKAKQAWQDARGTWKKYDEDYPQRGDRADARRMRGRAEAMLGDWKAAVASWKTLSEPMTDLEKLASLYQAHQLEKQHANKDK